MLQTIKYLKGNLSFGYQCYSTRLAESRLKYERHKQFHCKPTTAATMSSHNSKKKVRRVLANSTGMIQLQFPRPRPGFSSSSNESPKAQVTPNINLYSEFPSLASKNKHPLPEAAPPLPLSPAPPLPSSPPPLPLVPPPAQPPPPASTPPVSPPPASSLPKPSSNWISNVVFPKSSSLVDSNLPCHGSLPLPPLTKVLPVKSKSNPDAGIFFVDKMPSKIYIDADVKPRRPRQTAVLNKYATSSPAASYSRSSVVSPGRNLIPGRTFGPIRSHYAKISKRTSPELITLSDDEDEIVCLQEKVKGNASKEMAGQTVSCYSHAIQMPPGVLDIPLPPPTVANQCTSTTPKTSASLFSMVIRPMKTFSNSQQPVTVLKRPAVSSMPGSSIMPFVAQSVASSQTQRSFTTSSLVQESMKDKNASSKENMRPDKCQKTTESECNDMGVNDQVSSQHPIVQSEEMLMDPDRGKEIIEIPHADEEVAAPSMQVEEGNPNKAEACEEEAPQSAVNSVQPNTIKKFVKIFYKEEDQLNDDFTKDMQIDNFEGTSAIPPRPAVENAKFIENLEQIDQDYMSLERVQISDIINQDIDLSDETLRLREKLNQLRQWDLTGLARDYQQNNGKSDTIFTLMSYNVLGQQLLVDNMNLYTDCDRQHLTWSYRWALLQHEIEEMKADVLTLQEVQGDHYHQYYLPWFTHLGYQCAYKQRTSQKSDGCAIFFRKDKFEFVENTTVEFKQPNTFCDRDNVGLICILKSKQNGSNICIATTHLLFNPKRHDIKLAQLQMLLTEIERMAYTGMSQNGQPDYCPLIITGDFNCMPHTPVIRFLKDGQLNYYNLNSKTLTPFSYGPVLTKALLPPELGILDQCQHLGVLQLRNELRSSDIQRLSLKERRRLEETRICLYHSNRSATDYRADVRGSSCQLQHCFNLKSVYKHSLDRLRGEPEITTRANNPQTVDYIVYSQVFSSYLQRRVEGRLKLLGRYGLLSAPEARIFGPMPSSVLPSDHFPLAAKFLLKGGR